MPGLFLGTLRRRHVRLRAFQPPLGVRQTPGQLRRFGACRFAARLQLGAPLAVRLTLRLHRRLGSLHRLPALADFG